MPIHVLEVGRAPAMPARFEAESLDAAASYVARRTGREDALTLASIAWNGGSVQVGTLTVRGWSRSDQGDTCPHCHQQVYARAVTCAEEAEEAGLAEGRGPDTAWASLGLVFPASTCEFCGENLTFAPQHGADDQGETLLRDIPTTHAGQGDAFERWLSRHGHGV